MGQMRTGKKQLKVTSKVMKVVVTPGSDLSDDDLTRQNLSFLTPTRSGRNVSINKKYGV